MLYSKWAIIQPIWVIGPDSQPIQLFIRIPSKKHIYRPVYGFYWYYFDLTFT